MTWWKTYSWGWMSMLVRRRPGVSITVANAELTNVMRRSYQAELLEHTKSPPTTLVKPRAVAASILSERGPNESSLAKVATWVAGVAILVLLIACANVANLLLARALRRRREVAVRLALALAAIGLYSVIAYNVAQRTHEMGVRVAVGAQIGDVVRLVVTDGVKFGVLGLAIGAIAALSAARWIKPLLFDESPSDPLVFVLVTATLLAVTLAASWIPARRAARVDPQVALRTE